jgi:hypothetical protein
MGDLMDDSLSCMGRWLKMMMKQVTAVVQKGPEFVAKLSNIEFYTYGQGS